MTAPLAAAAGGAGAKGALHATATSHLAFAQKENRRPWCGSNRLQMLKANMFLNLCICEGKAIGLHRG